MSNCTGCNDSANCNDQCLGCTYNLNDDCVKLNTLIDGLGLPKGTNYNNVVKEIIKQISDLEDLIENNYVSKVTFSSNTLNFTGVGDAFNGSVDLSALEDYVDNVQLNGTDLEFTGVGDGFDGTIDLSSLVDYISNIGLSGSQLTITSVGDAFSGTIDFSDVADITQSVTHAQLKTLITNNNLKEGYYYLITDFETIYDLPDYEDTGGGSIAAKGTITTITASSEPLLVRAISVDDLAVEAYSPSNPTDIIHYEIDYTLPINSGTATKGRIIYRKDTVNNIETDFDFRAVDFKRYQHGGSGGYIYYYDNGDDDSTTIEPFDIATTYNFSSTGNLNYLSENSFDFDLPNFVVEGILEDTKIDVIVNSHFEGGVEKNDGKLILTTDFADDVIENSFVKITDSIFGTGEFGRNNFNQITDSTFSGLFQDNSFQSIDNSTMEVSLKNSFSVIEDSTIGASFVQNKIGRIGQSTTIGDNFQNNNIGNIANSTIGNNVFYNIFTAIEGCTIPTTVNGFIHNNGTEIDSVNFTGATHVFFDNDTNIFYSSTGSGGSGYYLSYVDTTIPSLVVVSATA